MCLVQTVLPESRMDRGEPHQKPCRRANPPRPGRFLSTVGMTTTRAGHPGALSDYWPSARPRGGTREPQEGCDFDFSGDRSAAMSFALIAAEKATHCWAKAKATRWPRRADCTASAIEGALPVPEWPRRSRSCARQGSRVAQHGAPLRAGASARGRSRSYRAS